MAAGTPRKRISAALDALDAAREALARLDAARRLREAADEIEAAELRAARKAGATWSDIGACYGLTKQGAQQRFRRGERSDPAPPAAPKSAAPKSAAPKTAAPKTAAPKSAAPKSAGQTKSAAEAKPRPRKTPPTKRAD